MKPMRRSRQALDPASCRAVLARGATCVLALAGSEATDGYPYALPVNYVYEEPVPSVRAAADGTPWGRLLIHCAVSGAKLDAITSDARVSACVIDADDIVPEKLTTHFRSVIAFGRARVLTDDAARRRALVALSQKYAPDLAPSAVEQEITELFARTTILAIELEQVTGKQARELV